MAERETGCWGQGRGPEGQERSGVKVVKVLDLYKRGFRSSGRSVFCPSSVCLTFFPFLAEPLSFLFVSNFPNVPKEGTLLTIQASHPIVSTPAEAWSKICVWTIHPFAHTIGPKSCNMSQVS